MKFKYLTLVCLIPVLCDGQVIKNFQTILGGIKVNMKEGSVIISPLSDDAVRIRFFKDTEVEVPELIFLNTISTPEFQVTDYPSMVEVKAGKIIVAVDKLRGNLSFKDKSGKIFLSEKSGSRKLIPDSVMGGPCFIAEQSFSSPGDEYLFGLGQFQDGHFNNKNVTRKLTQVNSQISLPFLYSNKGYGLLWHQYGLTDFNPSDNVVTIQKQDSSIESTMAEVTTTSGAQRKSQDQSHYQGKFSVPQNGVYTIFLDLGDMDNRHYVVIDGKPCIDFSNFWLPPTASAFANLEAGEHTLQLICKSSNKPKVSWRFHENYTTFRSPNARLLDYVVFYGPSADEVIASYRRLSGNAPLFPLWAYGFWQCRERYSSGKQLVEAVKEFRKRNLPMDVIVQDWQYWGKMGWGVPVFDTVNYANPKGFIKDLHDLNAHFNISIWSNPDRNSSIGKEYVSKNLYIPNKSKWLDYFNPETRKEYWKTLKTNLFDNGVDSWWMDATEPENDALRGEQTYVGAGDFYRLIYPLMVCKAVYEGQREYTSEKRVCILTRSAYLGQQRYGTINWSGDIGATWESYKRQIVAGLNYTMSGMPYWTTDIGGFFRPGNSQYSDEKYHELLTRWYQWGTFNPIFRIHGFMSETEPWKYGQRVEDNMRKMLDLRYRLLPYIYSEAWQVTKFGSTMMRPLVMDFREDTTAVNQSFEYLFGNALLTAPITEPDVDHWKVYLPQWATWFDFWTGNCFKGGQTVSVAAPLERIPLFVKSGSILPLGKFIQYAGQKAADTLELRIYTGTDGKLEFYEDEGDTYNYEKGEYSTIEFKWNESARVLTIGKRYGEFHGMVKNKTFQIVIVSQNHGTGVELSEKLDKIVQYDGKKMEIIFR
jgi:alpha-D-xyloside xylohydrolase